jgi:O-antigen ligase
MRIWLPLAAALVPLAFLPGHSFYFDITPKIAILALLTATALIFWNGSLVRGRTPATWLSVLLGLQIVWLGVATAVSRNPALSLNGGNWRRFGLITEGAVLLFGILAILDVAGNHGRVSNYLRAGCAAGIPIGLYGIVQYFGFDPWLNASGYHAGEGIFTIVRPPSTLGHASYFGTYLVYIVFLGLALCVTDSTRGWRVTGAIAAAVAFLAMVLSGTRGALAGLIAGVVLLAFRWPAARNRQTLLAGAAVAGALALFCISPAGAALRSRTHWSIEEPVGGARPQLWRDTLAMSAGKPWAGYGPETFIAQFPHFQSVALARAFPDFEHESPHNVFLDALVSQGVPGLALLLATAALALWTGMSSGSALATILSAGLAGGVVAQMFTSFTMPTALYFYLTAALIAGVTYEGTITSPSWVWRVPAAALAIFLGVWGVRLGVCDYQLGLVRQAFARDDFRGAVSAYQKARQWHPRGSSADLYFSRELANLFRRTRDARLKLQIWTPAFQAAVDAAGSSENPPGAFYNLAMFFATQNDAPDVERSLRTAIQWAPRWYKPHWALAQLLQQEGHLPQAREEEQAALAMKEIGDLP